MNGRTYHVYIMASRSRTLYIGITSNLTERVHQHKTNTYSGFTQQYRCHRLVWHEPFSDPDTAIAREKELKGWRREKKLTLITTTKSHLDRPQRKLVAPSPSSLPTNTCHPEERGLGPVAKRWGLRDEGPAFSFAFPKRARDN